MKIQNYRNYENPELQEKKYPIKLSEVSKINDIPDIKTIKVRKKDKYVFTKEESESFLSNYTSKDDAWIRIMNEVDDTLVNILDKKMKIILKEHEDIKYIIVWRFNASIAKICKKYNIGLINMEMAGFRKPSYNFTLSYFQHENKFSDIEFNKRYEKFMDEIKDKKVDMLTRSQLIKLMVSKDEIARMEEEQYYTGFAMGLAKDYDTLSTKSKTNNEIMEDLSKYEKKAGVLIRKHPANYHYVYDHEKDFSLDDSVSSIQFISKCHRVVSSVSNTGLEALLFGKTSFILGEMPFKRFGYQSLDYNDEYIINIKDLNFLLFCFFVPYEIALTNKYLEFRDSNPSEIEIYEYHYKYIMDKYGKKLTGQRIKDRKQQWIDNVKELDYLRKHNVELEDELQLILNSKSWKILERLRKLKKILKRKN